MTQEEYEKEEARLYELLDAAVTDQDWDQYQKVTVELFQLEEDHMVIYK